MSISSAFHVSICLYASLPDITLTVPLRTAEDRRHPQAETCEHHCAQKLVLCFFQEYRIQKDLQFRNKTVVAAVRH